MIVIPESWLYVLFMYVFPIYLACMLFVSIIGFISLKHEINEGNYSGFNELASYSLGYIHAIIVAPYTIIKLVVIFIYTVFQVRNWNNKGE